jgi:hypothetical protein
MFEFRRKRASYFTRGHFVGCLFIQQERNNQFVADTDPTSGNHEPSSPPSLPLTQPPKNVPWVILEYNIRQNNDILFVLTYSAKCGLWLFLLQKNEVV